MRKYYPGFTLFKLIGAMLIVLAHLSGNAMGGVLDSYIFGFSQYFSVIVPCFYMLSGFLAYRGWATRSNPVKYVSSYVSKLALIYAAFCLLYILTDTLPKCLSGQFNIHDWNGLVGLIFLIGPYPPLWFLPPLCFGIYLCFRLERAGHLKFFAVLLSLAFLFMQFVSGTLQPVAVLLTKKMSIPVPGLHPLVLLTIVRYFAHALPFVLAGVLVAKNEAQFLRLKKLGTYALLLLLTEALLLQVFQSSYTAAPFLFSQLTSTLWLFQLLMKARLPGIQKHYQFIQRFTLLMFLLHFPLMLLISHVMGWENWSVGFYRIAASILTINLLVAGLCVLWQLCSRKPGMSVPPRPFAAKSLKNTAAESVLSSVPAVLAE